MSEVPKPSPRVPSSGELTAEAAVQLGGLLGQEFALARAELRAHARHLGMGGTMLATAGFLGVSTWLVLLGAAIAALAVVLPVWAAALIVGGALGLSGGVAAGLGNRRLRRAMPPLPMTRQSLHRDLAEIKGVLR